MAAAVGEAPRVNSAARGEQRYFFLGGTTASLNALAKRNFTTVLAGILIGSPVCGLRPMRAFRLAFTAFPNPGITNCPELLASFVASETNS